jgi:hypothetical protein
MQIRPVDPRDTNWTIDSPVYRVYFWKRGTAPAGHPPDRVGHIAFEYELSECHNVREALAWADENAGSERSYTLYAAVAKGDSRGLVRLFGVDPTKPAGD